MHCYLLHTSKEAESSYSIAFPLEWKRPRSIDNRHHDPYYRQNENAFFQFDDEAKETSKEESERNHKARNVWAQMDIQELSHFPKSERNRIITTATSAATTTTQKSETQLLSVATSRICHRTRTHSHGLDLERSTEYHIQRFNCTNNSISQLDTNVPSISSSNAAFFLGPGNEKRAFG